MGNVMLKSGQAGRNYAQTLDKMKLSSAAVSDELIISSRGLETAGEAAKRLGVSFRDSNGQIRPFLDILPELKEKMKALPQQDQDVISRVLFGVEGGRAIQTTLRATGKDIDYLADALKNADGIADRTSKVMNEGLGGSFRSLGGSAQVLSNLMVDQVSPAIKAAIDGIVKIVNALSKDVSTLIGVLGGLAVSGIQSFSRSDRCPHCPSPGSRRHSSIFKNRTYRAPISHKFSSSRHRHFSRHPNEI
jgi:TP901 family phage tail tape measure protein